MSQERMDDVTVYLGLQGFVVESVEVVAAPWVGDAGRRITVVRVVNRSGRHRCPGCGKRLKRGLFWEHAPIRLRDCSIGDFETSLEVRPRRVRCCGGTRVERLPFAMPGFRMARRFFERVATLCTRQPVQAVAEMAGLAWETVARVDQRALARALGERSLDRTGLRWIGVDEVSRSAGHVSLTVVTDLERGRVVWIGDGRGEKGSLPFLEALRPEGCKRTRGVVSDLGYKGVVVTHLPQAIPIRDRFHSVQWMNEALNQLRRRLEEWIAAAWQTGVREIMRIAARMAPPVESVMAGHRYHVKLGVVESINSKIAGLRVQARGYRDLEYFKLKIFQRCGLPENPWAHIVL